MSLNLVARHDGSLRDDPAGARAVLQAISVCGGKTLLLTDSAAEVFAPADNSRQHSIPSTALELTKLLELESILADETVFLADNQTEADLAKAARLKVGSLSQFAASTQPDENWQDLVSAARWIERQGQLGKRAWPIATVGGLVFAPDDTALFVRTAKWGGTWGVPGGKIDYGETHLDAFIREIREETGLEALSPEFVLVQDAIEEPEFFRPRHFLLLNYRAHCASKDFRLNHESLEAEWFTLKQSLALTLNRPTHALVRHLLENG